MQLTPAANGQQGAAWHVDQIDVSLPFCLHISVNLGGNDGGADGIAFVMHQLGPAQPTTSTGGNMGYGNFNAPTNSFGPPTFDPSIIIEFDTWNNGNFGDPFYDHIALQRDGTNNHNGTDCLAGPMEASATSNNIEDGQDHTVHIEWSPATQSLRCEFDGVERFDANVDLAGDVFAGNSLVWWGFTGSTGGASNVQSFCLLDLTNSEGIPGLVLDPLPPYAVCPEEPFDITASAPGINVGWAGANSATLAATPGFHTVETASSGCPLTETIEVEGLPSPNLTTLPEITLCDGNPAVLTADADPGSSIDWDGTGNATLGVSTAGNHTVTAILGGCSETETVTVIDQASPVISLDTDNEVSLCDGAFLDVTASTDVPASITWTDNANGTISAGPSISVSEAGSFTVSAESGGCPGTPELIAVQILPLPTATIQSIPDALCWGETGLVSAVPNIGSTITGWTVPPDVPDVTQAGPGTYIANIQGANGCTNTATYFLEELPPIVFSLDGPEGACDGETVALTVAGNFETAAWSTGTGGNALTLTNADGEGPFSVTVASGGCEATASTSVAWWPVPSVGTLADTIVRCILAPPVEWSWPAQTASPVGWWVWSVNGMTVIDGPSLVDEGQYTVRILDSMTGCADSTSVVVDVWPNIEAEAYALAGVVCWDETTELVAELKAVGPTQIDEIPYTWGWNDPDVEGLNPTVPAGTYLLEVENACGTDAAFVEVTQEYCGCDMWVPTAFTPDNDGVNDGYKVETNCPELDEFLFQVFDRWGELVWSTDDPERAWVGQGIEGTAMEGAHYIPDGVYGYRLFWKYAELRIPIIEERHGHIHILR